MKTSVLIAALVTGGLIATGAHAQEARPWLKDRAYGEGAGIRTGDVELHPGAAVELGYDSNYFQRAGTGPAPGFLDERLISAVILRPTLSLSLSTLGAQRRAGDTAGREPPKVNFTAGVGASYFELLAVNAATPHDESVARGQRNVSALANAKLDILPEGPWGADILGDFTRTIQPSNDPNANQAFNRDSLRAGAGVIWRPGGGMFDWRLGYEFQLQYFEENAFRNLSTAGHYAKTRGRWRFLPRTALMYDAELGFLSYSNTNAQSFLNDSMPLRTRVGINGLITHYFAVLAMVGWGASFYQANRAPIQDYDSLIAQGEVKWFILPQPELASDAATVGLSSVAVGYTRDFANSYIAAFYQRDRAYAKLSYLVAGSLLFLLEGGYSHYYFPRSYFPNGTPGGINRHAAYNENRVDAQLFAEYRFTDSFGINTTLRYDANLTDTNMELQPNPVTGQMYDRLQFARYQAYLGLRWFM
jgi:hypothetical protein